MIGVSPFGAGPFSAAGGGGGRLLQGYRLCSGAPPAPSFDPSSIVAARAAGPGGWRITYQNGAAGRDQPDTGACWVFPIRDCFDRSLADMGLASLDLPRAVGNFRVFEREFTAASTVLIGVGIMDNADPAAATKGIGVSVGYPSTTVRQVNRHNVSAGAWATGAGGTADTTTFGASMTYCHSTHQNVTRQRCYPLRADFTLDDVPGTNNIEGTGTLDLTGMTHLIVWTGLSAAAGDGDIHTFDARVLLAPFEA
jgi:hypothetical protein